MQCQRLETMAGISITGPLLITPRVVADDRGFFFESWNQHAFAEALMVDHQPVPSFVQDNHSCSRQGVLRGLHYQRSPHPQGKLVRCVSGEILDVAVDLRRSSPTFGQWVAARLSARNYQQLWVPAGFAHGFLTLSAQAEVLYKTTDVWNRDCERAIRWDDPQLAIVWSNAAIPTPVLSDKDAQAPWLASLDEQDLFP